MHPVNDSKDVPYILNVYPDLETPKFMARKNWLRFTINITCLSINFSASKMEMLIVTDNYLQKSFIEC